MKMKKIVFEDCFAEEYENPNKNWLKELVFEADDDFWDVESGQAALIYSEDGEERSFIYIKGLKEFGFMLDSGVFPVARVPIKTLTYPNDSEDLVEATIGGEPSFYKRKYFVPKEIAWKAIEYFMETGEPHPEFSWEIAESLQELD